MFFLRVHTVDTDHHPLTFETTETSSANTASNHYPNPKAKFRERRDIAHLFRSMSHSSFPNPCSRSTLLFIVAVPKYLSFDDFIRLCGSRIDHVSELLFIRSNGMEDRYSVLIRLVNQLSADRFYCSFNGKKFSPGEAEVCRILFMMSVERTESAEIAGKPPAGCTELPTCPVCLERLDPDTSGILSTIRDYSFQCPCISKWTYLSCQVCRFCQQQGEKPACSVCGTLENLWVCMICGSVGCGRYNKGHAMRHWKDTKHCYTLDIRTQEIWDYVGESYVHRLIQSKNDGKLAEMNSHCMSSEGDCGTSGCSDDSVISGALFSSKVEAIVDDYNHLLTSQLETQRQYYESLLVEVKSKVESCILEAVEKAVTSKMQDIQNKFEKCFEEKNVLAYINRNLIKNQEIWRKVKEMEERFSCNTSLKGLPIVSPEEAAAQRLRDKNILDPEEQGHSSIREASKERFLRMELEHTSLFSAVRGIGGSTSHSSSGERLQGDDNSDCESVSEGIQGPRMSRSPQLQEALDKFDTEFNDSQLAPHFYCFDGSLGKFQRFAVPREGVPLLEQLSSRYGDFTAECKLGNIAGSMLLELLSAVLLDMRCVPLKSLEITRVCEWRDALNEVYASGFDVGFLLGHLRRMIVEFYGCPSNHKFEELEDMIAYREVELLNLKARKDKLAVARSSFWSSIFFC